MGGGGPSGAVLGRVPLERHLFTGAGTAEHPAGKNPALESGKRFNTHFHIRDETLVSKSGTEIVFRGYTPQTEAGFKKLAADPNFAAVKTATGELTFMQAGTAKIYLHSAKGERASIANPIWHHGAMAVGKKKDAFETPAGRQQMAKTASTVAHYVQQGFLKVVTLPGGGKGYKVAAQGANGDKAWNTLHKAGYSFRQKVGDGEVWMNQATWQKMQRM